MTPAPTNTTGMGLGWEGEVATLDRLRAYLAKPFAGLDLTPEQEETARLMARGYTQEMIANELKLSRGGVARRLGVIQKRTDCRPRDLTNRMMANVDRILAG